MSELQSRVVSSETNSRQHLPDIITRNCIRGIGYERRGCILSETDYEAKAESGAVRCSGKSSFLIDKLPVRVNDRYREYLESSSPDERYMARALQLAWRGCGW